MKNSYRKGSVLCNPGEGWQRKDSWVLTQPLSLTHSCVTRETHCPSLAFHLLPWCVVLINTFLYFYELKVYGSSQEF